MMDYLERFLQSMRPAFPRQATFVWFVIVWVGFVARSDTLGVSSIIRALLLAPTTYPALLHFFHSTAWSVEELMVYWWQWLTRENVAFRVGGRIVLLADHTKTPKDGRRMPAVTTLHQDSETASKPTFFRGHHWGCVGLLVQAGEKFFATPLWANIQQGIGKVDPKQSHHLRLTTQITHTALQIMQAFGEEAYLVLDAFFAVGTVFRAAEQSSPGAGQSIHILTRAKKNIVAYQQPRPKKKRCRGRPRKYGKKLKLMTLFDTRPHKFKITTTDVYQGSEKVRSLTLDLLWRPTAGLLRFFLFETSRGRIILMTSDLQLEPLVALQLYCRRVTIETMFDTLKNVMGAMRYHFWSKYLRPISRRPSKNKTKRRVSSQPAKTQNTFDAIEKFVNLQLLTVGLLQLLARKFPLQIWSKARCWLRTVTSEIPSEFVTRTALATLLRTNLFTFGKDWITQIIIQKQNTTKNTGLFRKVG
jgi:hypothetical protein